MGAEWGAVALLCSVLGYALGGWWFARGMKQDRPRGPVPEAAVLPRVSVVIAARDEEERIAACLQGLLAQDYPEELLEIILVDDGSSDGTSRRIREVGGTRVVLLSTREVYGWSGSKKAALTLGVQAARGEWILTTDADCRVPVDWVRNMARYFGPDTGMVVGPARIDLEHGRGGSWLDRYEALDFLLLMGCIAGSAGHGHPMAASGQNLAYRKMVFLQVGGYQGLMHRASGDDVLLLQRVRTRGEGGIVFAADAQATVRHPPAGSLGRLISKRTRWASNAPYQWRMDPLFFAYMLNTYLLSWALLLTPVVVVWTGPWAAGVAWALKIAGESAVLWRATALFRQRGLRRYFLPWILLQPLHVVLIGSLGCLGVFRWKGLGHRWGQRRTAPAEEAGGGGPEAG